MIALITMEYHALEKGLSMPAPKRDFGEIRAQMLNRYLDEFGTRYSDHEAITPAKRALAHYYTVRAESREEISKRSDGKIDPRIAVALLDEDPSTVRISRNDWQRDAAIDADAFFRSRRSVRDFATAEVSDEVLRRAIYLAQQSPSVCNRQGTRVHVFRKGQTLDEILRIQNGNSGFGHLIQVAIVVTSDLRTFTSPGERNQCWVDGGMFAMTLIWALHALGLGSCALNWSKDATDHRRLHKVAQIPDNEAVVMLLAVGHLKSDFLVARSSRYTIDHILRTHTS
ncbi:MAG: nitroreductase family protein [Bryobacteraceae bacterium]|nr:nitroreductase family protein [Bryobacteraceae bacterium]